MERIKVSPEEPAPEAVARAAEILRAGGVVAFPTETVYGICADALNPEAVRKLYAVKGRDPEKACAYLLAGAEAAERVAPPMPPLARRLATRLWPGPLTLVVPGQKDGESVGLRLPALELPRALADIAGHPLLQTSANRAGEPAALNAAAVAESLGGTIDLLLDGGRAPGSRSSTVVRCDRRSVTVLRAGAIPTADILRAASELTLIACTGNLCRSPFAEALFRKALAERLGCEPADLPRFGHRFASFGTMAMVNRPATAEAVEVGREHGLDLTHHRSRVFSLRLLGDARRVYGLANNHIEFLRPYFAARPHALELLDPKGREIQDPYGRPLKVYRKTADQIARAVGKRVLELSGEEEGGSGGR
ncbi:MAG TPA: L-threonylcarbamoyladenylate synthase [Planctomycetota bacterium]|nr:L-threonylcarbamoyladenylate synthase [Planctomycetota bacterium]